MKTDTFVNFFVLQISKSLRERIIKTHLYRFLVKYQLKVVWLQAVLHVRSKDSSELYIMRRGYNSDCTLKKSVSALPVCL